ncbi:MAG: hypothetical protein ACRDTC_01290 [Pseudonocardiaceae bacterium]
MAQPAGDNGDRIPETPRRASSDPTMLKALLRERHWQNYGMFTRTYQNAAKGLDKELVKTYPSLSTFRRWLAGQVEDLPHAEHCAVLEAMLPGWTAAELFQPPIDQTRSPDRHCCRNYSGATACTTIRSSAGPTTSPPRRSTRISWAATPPNRSSTSGSVAGHPTCPTPDTAPCSKRCSPVTPPGNCSRSPNLPWSRSLNLPSRRAPTSRTRWRETTDPRPPVPPGW